MRPERRRRWLGAALAALPLLLSPAAPIGAQEPSEASAGLGIGVAPFDADAPPGVVVPDVATLLADRLATRGVPRVVGPEALGASADADADAAAVVEWASRAQLDAIVVGRTTQLGSALSVDVRLRAGETGQVTQTYIQEIVRPADLESGVDALAGRLIEGAGPLVAAAVEPSAPVEGDPAAGPEASEPVAAKPVAAAPGGPAGDAPFGFRAWKSDQPLSIQSEEMEAIQKEGRRTLIFRRNVHVQQGDLDIRCAELEAYYPADASQPHRLVGRGKVRLVQGQQRAFCDEAVYERVKDRLVCRGNARFEDGDNSLVGDVIHIDLAAEKITVKGGASVLIQPEDVSGGDPS